MNHLKIMIPLLATALAVTGFGYTIDQYVIGLGGGSAESSSYKISGTVGQTITGTSESANYSISTGLWINSETEVTYDYIPGDVSMAAGIWPPEVIMSDVTYLINYFRGKTDGCKLNGFFAAADVNGDCRVISNDVTYLINYFRGKNTLKYCPDYKPAWKSAPSAKPSYWPQCESQVVSGQNQISTEKTR